MGAKGSQPQFDPRRSIELHRDWLLGLVCERDLPPLRGWTPVRGPSPKIVVPAQDDPSAPWELALAASDHQDPLVGAAACALLRMLFANLDHDLTTRGWGMRVLRDNFGAVRKQIEVAASLARGLQTLSSGDIEAVRGLLLPLISGGKGEIGPTYDFIWQEGWKAVEKAASFLVLIEEISIEVLGLQDPPGAEKTLLRQVLQDLRAGGWHVRDVSRQLIDDSHNDNNPKRQQDRLRHFLEQPMLTSTSLEGMKMWATSFASRRHLWPAAPTGERSPPES